MITTAETSPLFHINIFSLSISYFSYFLSPHNFHILFFLVFISFPPIFSIILLFTFFIMHDFVFVSAHVWFLYALPVRIVIYTHITLQIHSSLWHMFITYPNRYGWGTIT